MHTLPPPPLSQAQQPQPQPTPQRWNQLKRALLQPGVGQGSEEAVAAVMATEEAEAKVKGEGVVARAMGEEAVA